MKQSSYIDNDIFMDKLTTQVIFFFFSEINNREFSHSTIDPPFVKVYQTEKTLSSRWKLAESVSVKWLKSTFFDLCNNKCRVEKVDKVFDVGR